MGDTYSRLMTVRENPGPAGPGTGTGEELQKRLATQLLLATQELTTRFFTLTAEINQKLINTQRLSSFLDMLALSLLALLLAAAMIFLQRSVVKPVLQLHEGAEIIGAGNLDHKVEIASRDEIGDLSRAFDLMTGNLQQRTAELTQTVAQLEEEVRNRQEAEEAIRAASAYARSLIEASLDPLVTISPQGKITDVNQATEGATGIDRARLVGTDFSDYFTEPDKAREGYRQVFSQGLVVDYPLTLRHASGRLLEVLYNATIYRNEAGEVQGVFAAARDITKQKQAEEAIRAASAYARSLIEASLDPLVTISPEGKITDVNQATEGATGIDRARLVGTDFSDYFTEPDKAREGYRQVFSQGLVVDYPSNT